MVIIATNSNDRHADIIGEKMKEKGMKFIRINTETIFEQTEITVEFDEAINIKPLVNIIDINNIQSVWYRRPKSATVSKEINEKSAIDFIREETNAVISGLWLLMKNCYWISDPWATRKASNKIHQLNLARSIGFTIPKTIITTSPTRAKQFYEKCKKNIITKVLTYGTFEEDGYVSIILTNKVQQENIDNIDLIRICPTLFQEYIEKKTEFRITVVGNKVFACEIYSQESETTKIDWRNYGTEISYASAKLPQDIEEKCIRLVKELNLNFGAIDIIRTPNDQFVFLEINPSGQWYWIEEQTGLPISEALIDLLTNH